MVEPNAVLVGRKPVMIYVFACMTLIQEGVNEVNVKARGRAISRAVDVAEIVKRKFQDEIKVKEIKIGTDQITDEQTNSPTNVSTIEIVLAK
ncbi:MAG TPA: DNA-binding protein Alba [archaeon]|jgi:DNA-binding protein|nr:DNA-binding protein Alba [archaeon]